MTKVIRRNHSAVPWDIKKVEEAVAKALIECEHAPEDAAKIAKSIDDKVIAMKSQYLHVEHIQDMVEEELMKSGYYQVAKAYVIYRHERRKRRESESEDVAIESIEIKSHDGTAISWSMNNLRKRIQFAMIGLNLSLNQEQIEKELRRSISASGLNYDGLKNTILLNAKALIERDPDFSLFAGRILLTYIYEEVLGWDVEKDGIKGLKTAHRKKFASYIDHGIKIGRLSPKLKEYDLTKIAKALDPTSDFDFELLGVQTLYDRYLIIDKTGDHHRRLEVPQFFWMRVAMGLFLDDEPKEKRAIQLYDLYRHRRFCSSTPTLFNSGTAHSQLSSCYLYYVGDSITDIFTRGIAENAELSKWAGGLGGSWTAVRGTGSHIRGTNGESQGIIPFLKIHNSQLVAVSQGSKRKGTGCVYLETWHNDLHDFLELRRTTGDDRRRCHDMNTANWIPDLFMKRVESQSYWTFFRSSECPDLHETYGREFEDKYIEYERKAEAGEIWFEREPAIEVWKKMLKMLFESGHPWITFKDPCNIRSPQDHAGVIHSSNLCTEITLNTGPDETAVCNLGSVVLDNHLTSDGEIDSDKLHDTIKIAVRALDNVIDLNFYPTEAAKKSNLRHRPIGMGVMGLQNTLYKKGIPFDSEEAIEFNDEFMEQIAYYAYQTSSELAEEKGKYESYEGSKWDRGILPQDSIDMLEKERGRAIDIPRSEKMDWGIIRKKIATNGMRNSNVLAIAPTATISNIMGSTPCIEPIYKHLFVKSNLSGDFIVLNRFLVNDLKIIGAWDDQMIADLKYFDGQLDQIDRVPDEIKNKYRTAFSISPNYLIDAAARRQKWIDQSQSVNLFLAKPDMKTLSHMYKRAWNSGLKTTYYLRTLGASGIEKATIEKRTEAKNTPAAVETPKACSLDDPDCEACQ